MSTIASRITEFTLPSGGRVAVAPTRVSDVVTIAGSIIGGPNAFASAAGAAAAVAGDLLDAGAGNLGKEAFRASLAARGAELQFVAEGMRLSWTATCFPEDTKYVIERIADALFSPALPSGELPAEKLRALTALDEEASDTRAQAERAALRLIYPGGHPSFVPAISEERARIEALAIADVKAVARSYGTRHLAMAIAGDVDANALGPVIERAFGRTPAGLPRPSALPGTSAMAKRADVRLADKANADVVMSSALGFTTDDARYVPAAVVIHALGGSFASHLMQTVRERDGLTYGVRSSLKGFDDKLDGYLRIWGTFAPNLLMRGIDTLSRETALFLKSGVTEDKLIAIKEEIAGSYAVSLSTTTGLAMRIVRFMEDDRPLSYVDEYPEIIGRVTLKEAQDAAAYLASLPLSVATAGSF